MKNFCLFACAIVMCIVSLSAEATVRIGGTGSFYPTIQAAITAAYDGAEIHVSTGVYHETFDIVGTNLAIKGGYNMNCTVFLTHYNTIINGAWSDVVDISDAAVELTGLGIINGGNGIDISDGTLTCRYCRIQNNLATFGGGVYANDSALVFRDNTRIFANRAYSHGGGIYISNCDLVLEESSVINNLADNSGGGIAAFENSALLLTNTMVGQNVATNFGGGMYAEGSNVIASIYSCTVVSNSAGEDGGGISWQTSNSLQIIDGAVNYNKSGDDGGGIALAGHGFLIVENSEVMHNAAANGGGGFFASKGFISCLDTDIMYNSADNDGDKNGNGGGLCISGAADVDLNAFYSTTEISSNSAANGGALYIDSGQSVMINAAGSIYHIRNNQALLSGGAICANYNSYFLGMGRVWIGGNSALNGGGIYAAKQSIAGLMNIAVFKPVLYGNIAEDNGGAMFAKGTNSALVLVGTRVGLPGSGNSAHHNNGYDGGGGGAALFGNATLQASDSIFQDNESWNYGGGIYASNAVVRIYSDFMEFSTNFLPLSMFIGNTATNGYDNGGGIYVRDSSLLSVSDTMFISNFANSYGGGAYSYGYSTCEFINTVFVNNEAGNGGGGLYGSLVSDIVLLECTIANNTTQGIYGTNPITLTNCIVWGNAGAQLTGVHPHNVHYSDIEGGHAGVSNINENPLFVNPSAGDYSLSAGSPCVDAGYPLAQITNDCVGVPRPYDSGWDMGCYEYIPEPGIIMTMSLLVICAFRRVNWLRRHL